MRGVLTTGRRWLAVGCLTALVAGCTSSAVPAAAPSTSVAVSIAVPSVPELSPAVSSVALSSAAKPSLPTPASSSPAMSTPALSTPDLSSPDLSTADLSTAALSTPDLSTPAPPTGSSSTASGAPSSVQHISTPPAAVALPPVDLGGVNLVGCRSVHRPVVLLHGSFSTVGSNFSALVPTLRASGRCVFGLNYGNGGIAAITSSAGQAAALVTSVLATTGTGAVDVIAYSQGGLVLRTALRLDGLADKVATAVLIAPSWNGTTSRVATSVPSALCPACADQVAGSPLLQRLSAGGDLDGSVRYAEISTRADIVVTPISSQVPTGPADRVRSVVVEDVCPALVTDHIQLPAVRGVINWTVAALDTAGRPAASAVSC